MDIRARRSQKRPPPRRPSRLSPRELPARLKYNRYPGECRWPITKMGRPVKNCNFNVVHEGTFTGPRDELIEVVRVPTGTRLYHSTTIYPGQDIWFVSNPPSNMERGVVWFTSDYDHTGYLSKTHILEYTVTEDLILIFEQNMSVKYGEIYTGFEYVEEKLTYLTSVLDSQGVVIDGYMGCNECEIALFNGSILQKLNWESPTLIWEAEGMGAFFD